jgi:iron complex outermembrane receptor protein
MNRLSKTLSISICILIIAQFSSAQTIPVRITITNQKDQPVASATITVVNGNDSLQKEKKIADSLGVVSFNLKKDEQYIVQFSAVGYAPFEKGIRVSGSQNRFSFVADNLSKKLDAVVVTSKKPLMRQEDDKTIVDPENLVASSTSGFEVIEKIPGIFMDQDGNIYLNSMTPATIYINGREMKMSAADIATILKSLPPNAIDKIEVMRTPSAKYDASGSGGVVNVVLKKGVKLGKTGSVSGGMNQGVYGNQFAGLNINNSNDEKSSFINLNVSHRNSYEIINTNRQFATDTILQQQSFTKYPAMTYFAGYGFAGPINKKWDYDIGISASFNDFNNKSDNNNSIQKISSSQTLLNSLNRVNNNGNSLNYRTGASFKYKVDSLGSEWKQDLFYNYTGNKNEQAFSSLYMTPAAPTTSGDGESDNKRHFFHYMSDLRLRLPNKILIETGLKSTLLRFRSETEYFNEANGNRVKDFGRTNIFNYDENINSIYAQGSKTLGKDLIIKTGVRLENTNMKGRQLVPEDTSFTIHRTDLFPYVYISYPLMKIMTYQLRAYLVYRRTLARPAYEQLNPFPRYIDQYLSEVGNPSLRPQFTQNYEFNVSFEETPVLAVGFNDTKDIFSSVIYQADSTQSQAYRTVDNLGKNKEWYIRGIGALPPGGKYFFVLGAQYNHNFYDGSYEAKPLSYTRSTWMMFTYHTLKLDKRSAVSMNGFVRFRGLLQFTEVNTFGALNFNINRKFLKDKLTVTLAANDVFFTNKYDFAIKQGTVNAYGLRENDTRRFGINFRYNFGIRKKEENKGMFEVESPEGK